MDTTDGEYAPLVFRLRTVLINAKNAPNKANMVVISAVSKKKTKT